MQYLMWAALLVNMNMIAFFFQIPYQVSSMGGSWDLVHTVSILNSAFYIIMTGISSCVRLQKRHISLLIRGIPGFLSLIYAVTCFVPDERCLLPIAAVHGLLIGIFWPAFWAAFYEFESVRSFTLGTEMLLTTGSAVFGPAAAGFLYRYLDRYTLLVFALLMAVTTLFGRSKRTGPIWKMQPPKHTERERFKVSSSVSGGKLMRVIITAWILVSMAGYLEGLFRSAAAEYLLNRGMGASAWGMLQSVKLTAQILAVVLIRAAGEDRFAFSETKRCLLAGTAGLAAGAAALAAGSGPVSAFAGMVLFGTGCGVVHFLCMRLGAELSGPLNRNLNAVAESVTGIGILAGSAASGYFKGDPFAMYAGLLLSAIVITWFVYGKDGIFSRYPVSASAEDGMQG